MANILGLKCASCCAEYAPGAVDYTCPSCGPLLGTLEVVYDFSRIKKSDFKAYVSRQPQSAGHWRYLPLLPIENPALIQPMLVGNTPIYRAAQLEKAWGIDHIWVKDDSRNPTASLKDRASSVAVVKALEKGRAVVTAASTGNAASSWSAFTALAGLKNYIFVPENAPKAKLAQLLLYGATVLKVRGSYDEAYDLCCQAAEKWGWYNRSTAINPYLGEGKKSAAIELCEQLGWQPPDYLFVAVGDGCIFQGMWKGFQDLYALGVIDRLPKMIGVQAAGSAPLVHAWKANKSTCEPVKAQTVADSISVGVPRDQVKALKAARDSGGQFIAVSDEEILAAITLLAQKTGVFAEPAGATAMAGAKKLITQGHIKGQDSVVVMVTGHGLKDVDGVMKAVARESISVENSLDAVEAILK